MARLSSPPSLTKRSCFPVCLHLSCTLSGNLRDSLLCPEKFLLFIHPPSSPTSPPPFFYDLSHKMSVSLTSGNSNEKIAPMWSSHVINMNSLNQSATEETLVHILDFLKENRVTDHMAGLGGWSPFVPIVTVIVASSFYWEGIQEKTARPQSILPPKQECRVRESGNKELTGRPKISWVGKLLKNWERRQIFKQAL